MKSVCDFYSVNAAEACIGGLIILRSGFERKFFYITLKNVIIYTCEQMNSQFYTPERFL